MRARIGLPSPSMVVSCIALFVAFTGSAAAITATFATNAGKVDGKDAVAASALTRNAAGKLVATNRAGFLRGRIDPKHLPPFVAGPGFLQTFGQTQDVVNGQTGAAVTLLTIPGFGTLSATCADEGNNPSLENPRSTITFTNASGTAVSFSREFTQNASTNSTVGALANNTVTAFNVSDSATFEFLVHRPTATVTLTGAVRQDGRGTAAAQCVAFGQSVRVG